MSPDISKNFPMTLKNPHPKQDEGTRDHLYHLFNIR